MASPLRSSVRVVRNLARLSQRAPRLAPRGAAVHLSVRHKSTEPAKSRAADIEITNHLRTYNVTKADAKPVPSEHHSISFDHKKVSIPWDEGKTSKFHHIWLRDHCPCPECRHPETQQRLVNTFAIPKDIKPESVEQTEAGLSVHWRDGHHSTFEWSWLHLHSYDPRLEQYFPAQLEHWDASILSDLPSVQYDAVMSSDAGVAQWVAKIHRYGFCFVTGVPVTPEDTEKLAERIAFVRPTHYGGFWDFTADLSKKDTAYTTLPLANHTDNTYFSDPAGLQMFHLLEHVATETDAAAGGLNTLVDGFHAAKLLLEENPAAYKLLSKTRIPAHASGNEDVSITPYAPFPVFNHHPVTGELVQVRWNNDDRGTMDSWRDPDDVEEFYDAIRAWDRVLRKEGLGIEQELEPGKVLIFDNWRVLHGRTSFTGKRRLCGAYINMDDFKSRLRTLCMDRKDLLRTL